MQKGVEQTAAYAIRFTDLGLQLVAQRQKGHRPWRRCGAARRGEEGGIHTPAGPCP